jgi:hypothetical protein
MLLLWGTCWVISVALLLFELIRPIAGRSVRLVEASVMVAATGGILNCLLSSGPSPASLGLRATADAMQLAGAVGVIFFSVRKLRAGTAP